MNRFTTVKLNVGLARLASILPRIIKMASARVGLAETMLSQEIHYILECPVVQTAGHIIFAQAPATRR